MPRSRFNQAMNQLRNVSLVKKTVWFASTDVMIVCEKTNVYSLIVVAISYMRINVDELC